MKKRSAPVFDSKFWQDCCRRIGLNKETAARCAGNTAHAWAVANGIPDAEMIGFEEYRKMGGADYAEPEEMKKAA